MGLPLDTTAAQPKLKLYRYGSPSLSLSATLFVHLFHLSLSLSLFPFRSYNFLFLTRSHRLRPTVYIYLSVSLSLSLSVPIVRSPACFSFSRLSRLSSYIRGAIVNGLQPLPGIYPRNLPSASSVTPLALNRPIPRHPSRGSTDCAL